jgi:hypothetical protein
MTAEGATPREPDRAQEALRRLEDRLDRASAAADRLMSEAMHAAGDAAHTTRDSTPPPSGWQFPEAEPEQRRDGDLDVLIALARSLRDLIPPELQQRLINALREVLHALRDLLDWYLERLDRQRSEPMQVQDIPIL